MSKVKELKKLADEYKLRYAPNANEKKIREILSEANVTLPKELLQEEGGEGNDSSEENKDVQTAPDVVINTDAVSNNTHAETPDNPPAKAEEQPVNPAHAARLAEAKAYHEGQEKGKKRVEKLATNGDKVVRVIITPVGIYSQFVRNAKKEDFKNLDRIERVKHLAREEYDEKFGASK